MSHRIVFKHAVLLFPVKTLYSAINDWSFYDEDHYLLLELGGDNNCTTSHPDSNQEVVSRDWAALAFGDRYRLIEEAVKLSADCECGGMRLSTQRHTSPETYVRHVRKAMANPIRFDEANGIGITVNATFKESTPCLNEVDVKKLQYHAQPPDEIEGGKVWRLNPLNRAKDAALLMLCGRSVPGLAWNVVDVKAPRFPCEGQALFSRLRARKAA